MGLRPMHNIDVDKDPFGYENIEVQNLSFRATPVLSDEIDFDIPWFSHVRYQHGNSSIQQGEQHEALV